MSEWISVKEKMPSLAVPVLCFGDYVSWHINYTRYNCIGSTVWAEDYEVTHWMPLPEPPKD